MAIITSLSEQLGNDLGEIVGSKFASSPIKYDKRMIFSVLDEAITGTNISEVLSAMLGEVPEEQIESLLEGVNLNTMEMLMNCECKKKE